MAPPVPEVGTVPLALLLLLVLLVSALLVAVMIGYARRRGLLDHPGQRRLHRQPTPRGGGAGIVLALLVGLPLLALTTGVAVPAHGLLLWWLALLLTALLGARDDHGGLGIAPRLTGHLLAGALLAASLWPWLAAALGWPLVAVAAGLLVLATAWSINLHNFMDGSDGLLAAQALLVALGLALLAGSAHAVALRATALLLAAAVAGFAPFNLPLPRADGFPVMVMQAGLAQALGFMLAKGQGDTNAYGCYLDDLALVLLGKHGHARGEAGRNLHKEVIEADLTRYRRMTRDILMVAGWFKRFGQAYLGKTGMGERP